MSSKEAPILPGTPDSLSDSKDEANTPPLENAAPEFKPGTPFYLAFVSLCLITLAAAFDATSLSIALPIITDKLHGTAIQAFWSGTSFLVTSAVFQPVIAGLSHGFGRKLVWHPISIHDIRNSEYLHFLDDYDIYRVLRSGFNFGCRG